MRSVLYGLLVLNCNIKVVIFFLKKSRMESLNPPQFFVGHYRANADDDDDNRA